MTNFRAVRDLVLAEIIVDVSSAERIFLASLTEIWVSGITFATTLIQNFVPGFVSDIINGLILTPILMVAYSAVVERSGRSQAGTSGWETPRKS
jgi:energy-coupling factor transport system substrate-specific component